jgi:hypothetical protein
LLRQAPFGTARREASGGQCLGFAFAEEFAGVGLAAAALSRDAELALKIRHAAGALLDAAADIAVGDAIADADVHGGLPMMLDGTITIIDTAGPECKQLISPLSR